MTTTSNIFSPPSIALLMVLTSLIVFFFHPSPECYGLTCECAFANRFYYIFMHANGIHLTINGWSLLCIAFYYNIKFKHILLSFIIACSFPTSIFIPAHPIIGMSGFIYALIGLLFFCMPSKRKILYALFAYSIIGMCFGNMAVDLHLYCFYIGFALSIFVSDIFED